MSGAEQEWATRFSRAVLHRDKKCAWANNPDHECSGRLDAHHIIKAQTLKEATRARAGKPGRWAIVYDPRIGITLCRSLHELVDRRLRYLRPADVRSRVYEYVGEHEYERLLVRAVPDLDLGFVLATVQSSRDDG